MNNIEKKLDALIDALGFDVEESTVNPVDYVNSLSDTIPKGWRVDSCRGEYIRSQSGCYQITADSFTDYKLINRKDVELIKAMDRAIELIYSEYGQVEPEIVVAFEAAGANQ